MRFAYLLTALAFKLQVLFAFIQKPPSYVWNRHSLRTNIPLFNQRNNASQTNTLKGKNSFTFNTANAMDKFLQRAKDLRSEADVLVSKSSSTESATINPNGALKSIKSDVSGFVRDDIVVNKTVNIYVNSSDSAIVKAIVEEEDDENGPILVPRDKVQGASLLRDISEAMKEAQGGRSILSGASSDSRANDTERNDAIVDFLKSINTSTLNQPYYYNTSLLPSVESITKDFPWGLKRAMDLFNWVMVGSDDGSKNPNAVSPADFDDEGDYIPSKVKIVAFATIMKKFLQEKGAEVPSLPKLNELVDEMIAEVMESIRVPLDVPVIDADQPEEEDQETSLEGIKILIGLLDVGLLKILKIDPSQPLDGIVSDFREFLTSKGLTSPTMKTLALKQNFLEFLFAKYIPSNPAIIKDLSLDLSSIAANTSVSDASEEGLSDVLESFMRAVGTTEEELDVRDTAERTLAEYFDSESRSSGEVLTRSSAGRLQTNLLKDLFVTSTVSLKFGAVVFSGRPVSKSSKKFAEDVAAKYASSRFKDDFKYFLLTNNKYSSYENSDVQNALDSLSGTSTAVVMYPSSWNSTTTASLRDEGKRFWRSAFISASFISSGIFAASLIGGDNPFLSDDYLPLSFGAIFIQTIAIFGEALYAALRKFSVSLIVTPSFRIGSWGPRTLYTSMPANLNELFDASFVGVAASVLLSFAAILIGLDITANADVATVAAMPALPQGVIKASNLVSELVQWKFPGSLQEAGSAVHLHWLAISGIISMIASIFQLIPIDNSAGSKMSYAALGVDNFYFLNAFGLFFRVVFLLPFIFDFGSAASDITTKALLVDFFFSSTFAGNNAENQLAIDNVTEISDGRKTAIVGLILLLLYSFLPYGELFDEVNKILVESFEYLSNLVAGAK